MSLLDFVRNYQAYDEIEQEECKSFLQFLEAFGDLAYERENLVGHLSATTWIVNPKRDKALMVYHNMFKAWTWAGGHADGDKNLAQVAIKEAEEETGLKNVRLLQQMPIDINVLSVDNHIKRGKFVPRHLHYNVVYCLEADENEAVHMKPDENAGVKWLEFDNFNDNCLEAHIKPYYERIIKKIKDRKL